MLLRIYLLALVGALPPSAPLGVCVYVCVCVWRPICAICTAVVNTLSTSPATSLSLGWVPGEPAETTASHGLSPHPGRRQLWDQEADPPYQIPWS